MAKKKEKEHSKWEWFIEVCIITFVLSICFSYISTNGVSNLSLIPAILILILVIAVGVAFDIVAVAVTVANEEEFHAKATKKVKGSKDSIKLIRNAPRVANFCADVIGDICGIISGSAGAIVAALIAENFNLPIFYIALTVAAFTASFTIGGKAIGKGIAIKNNIKIVSLFSKLVSIFYNKKK